MTGHAPKYGVKHLEREGKYPQSYRYAVWRGNSQVADYGHDFRNDARWLVIGGATIPVDINLLAGGGPEPLIVSEEGAKLLDRLLDEKNSN